jgi:hypothetical protein
MLRQFVICLVLFLAVFSAVSAPGLADEDDYIHVTPCVKIKPDPPSVVVDPGCIPDGIPPPP